MVLAKRLDRCQEYLGEGSDLRLPRSSQQEAQLPRTLDSAYQRCGSPRGLSYSQLMGGLHKAGIEINRKVLADLAVNNPQAFKAIVEKAK